MKKLSIQDVVFEITRRCNMKCDHCLRGDAQNLDLSQEYVRAFLDKVGEIRMLSLSGGEPSIALDQIRMVREEIQKAGVAVRDFQLSTNGKEITREFAYELMEFWALCYGRRKTVVEISNSQFHLSQFSNGEQEQRKSTIILSALKFVAQRYTNPRITVVPEGRGKVFGGSEYRRADAFELGYRNGYIDVSGGDIYVNCLGEVLSGCDWSYDSQKRRPDVRICEVGDFSIQQIVKYNEVIRQSLE